MVVVEVKGAASVSCVYSVEVGWGGGGCWLVLIRLQASFPSAPANNMVCFLLTLLLLNTKALYGGKSHKRDRKCIFSYFFLRGSQESDGDGMSGMWRWRPEQWVKWSWWRETMVRLSLTAVFCFFVQTLKHHWSICRCPLGEIRDLKA